MSRTRMRSLDAWVQGGLFDEAAVLRDKAVHLMRGFDGEAALAALRSAREINPDLTGLDTIEQTAQFLCRVGVPAAPGAADLSRLWVQARADYVLELLSLRSLRLLESVICARAVKVVSRRFRGYLDPNQPALHIGYCYLVLGNPVLAHRRLFDDLAWRPLGTHGDLWGYLGDAAYELEFTERSNLAYVRALFGDPEHVDLGNIRHPDIRRVYDRLRAQHREGVARQLLPIHACVEGCLDIPDDDLAFKSHLVRRLRESNRLCDREEGPHYRRFSFLFYLSASGSGEDTEAWEQMKSIDEPLFERCRNALGRPSGMQVKEEQATLWPGDLQ